MLGLVQGAVQRLLDGAEVAPDQPLMEAGLDSLGELFLCSIVILITAMHSGKLVPEHIQQF